MRDQLIELPGTVRARSPQETWDALSAALPSYGITRVARLTDLDVIGLPTWTAIRPASLTLSASQGKGLTDDLARVSAVMEAIELWHVEQPLPVPVRGRAVDVAPDCPVGALPLNGPVDEAALARVVWDWTPATGLVRGTGMLLPVDVVRRRAQRGDWSPDLLRATSTGLACGNSREEAVLHGLYEVVERDVLHRDNQAEGGLRVWIEPGTVDDATGREVVERVLRAGMELELALVEGPYGLPVCLAYLWSEDLPVVFAGGGCHHSPGIALTRAVTEAAQSRLTLIAGTRDDLPDDIAPAGAALARPARSALVSWKRAAYGFAPASETFAERVHATAAAVERVTGHEPAAIALSEPDDLVPAVQVVCPGAGSRVTRTMPR
ncbi:YcaO-like family protein [Kitasatospora sp. NPDC096204]|uniref:YcaO-like family protein n=1 Tax=Kitasatospora sp. NPDC096204 TaxID=3364094 RepID=UPI00381BC092